MNGEITFSEIKAAFPKDKPIIFWDTCSLLDVLRKSTRDVAKGPHYIKMYEDIADAVEQGDIVSVTSHLVRKELTEENYEKERKELAKQCKKFLESLKFYSEYLHLPPKTKALLQTSGLTLTLENKLRGLFNRLVRNTKVLAEDSIYKEFAHQRVVNKMTPAKTKQEYKDSYIWASFCHFVKELEPSAPLVAFVSSNTTDFLPEDSDLQNDCSINPNMNYYLGIDPIYAALVENDIIKPS